MYHDGHVEPLARVALVEKLRIIQTTLQPASTMSMPNTRTARR